MDEQEYQSLLAEYEATKQRYAAWKAAKEAERPAFDRFTEQLPSVAEAAGAAGRSLWGLAKLPFSAAGTIAREATSPGGFVRALSTGGTSLVADPITRAAEDYGKSLAESPVPGADITEDVSALMTGVVPFGDVLGKTAQELGATGELPRAEDVGRWVKQSAGPEVASAALGPLGKYGVRASDVLLGPSLERVAKEAVNQGPGGFERVFAGALEAHNSRAAAGIQQAKDALRSVGTISEMTDASGRNLVMSADRSIEGFTDLHKNISTAREAAAAGREKLLDNVDARSAWLDSHTKPGQISRGKASLNDFDFSKHDIRFSNAGPETAAALQEYKLAYFDPLASLDGRVAPDGSVAGLSLSELQGKIKEIDNTIREIGGYDDATRAQQSLLKQRDIGADVPVLQSYRGIYQDALEKKLSEMQAYGGKGIDEVAEYRKFNKTYQAARDIEPLMDRSVVEGIPSAQQGASGSLNTAVRSSTLKGAAVDAAANQSTKRISAGLQREANAIRQMQALVSVRQGQYSLLSRSLDFAKNSATQNMLLANLAFEIGAIADPGQWPKLPALKQKEAFVAMMQYFPDAFEPPASGAASEIDGEILDPFEKDYYLKRAFRESDDPIKRADTVGRFLSTGKVPPKEIFPNFQTPMSPGANIIELAPDVDGGFSFNDSNAQSEQMEDQSITAMLLNANLTRQLQDLSY